MGEYRGHRIERVEPGSIADQLEIEPGDVLLTIDGEEIEDILDYRFRVNTDSLLMVIKKPDGEQWELDIENDYEDIGLDFGTGIMSDYRRCSNACIFCFIDQMPPGMRETLYFKDDDARLSFLQGNYVTLTNMKDRDIDRIIRYRMSPINISFHTTDPELRCRMLRNRNAGKCLSYVDRLYEAGIEMNGQIVLCPGYNDGEALQKTLEDMMQWLPVLQSVSIVPVGLTRYREGLTPLRLCTEADAAAVIDLVETYQKKAMDRFGIHAFHASDEFYLKAGRPLPEESRYDGYLQLENGVGMLRLLLEEVEDALSDIPEGTKGNQSVSIATGVLAEPVIAEAARRIEAAVPGTCIRIYPVDNDFFGHDITVAGLLTGQDLAAQLAGKELGDRLLLPISMFRSGEETFLDDLTRADLEEKLGVRTVITASSGYDLVHAVLDSGYHIEAADTELLDRYEVEDE